jgi:hypothetical protein
MISANLTFVVVVKVKSGDVFAYFTCWVVVVAAGCWLLARLLVVWWLFGHLPATAQNPP